MAMNKHLHRGKALVSCLCLVSLFLLIFHAPQGNAQTQTIKMPIKKPGQKGSKKPDAKTGTPPSKPSEESIPAPKIPADYDAEMRRVNNLIERNSKDADAFFTRGWLHDTAGKHQLATQDYTKAIEINSKHANAYYNRGLVFARLKQYEQAAKDFSEVIKLQPSAVDAYCNRANAYFQLGRMKLALQDFNAGLGVKPNDPDLYYNRGLVYEAMGEKSKAAEDMRKAAQAGHAKAKEHLKTSR